MTTVGAFVMTYRRPEGLRRSIEFLLSQTFRPDPIWVIDNDADPDVRQQVEAYADDGVRYVASPDNIGPAGAMATGFRLMLEYGSGWCLQIDDDDAPQGPGAERVVQVIVDTIERHADDDRLGMVGIAGARFDWKRGEMVRIGDDELQGDLDVDVIGGGLCLTVRREMVEEIGLPNADLFFGVEEVTYCLRGRRAGYRALVAGEALYESRVRANRLNLQATRRTKVATDPDHALWRRYYVTRNYIHTMRHELESPRLAHRMAAKAMVQSGLSFGRGFRYGSRYSALQLRGIVDGYRGKLGRTIQPKAKPVTIA